MPNKFKKILSGIRAAKSPTISGGASTQLD
jgi:hypothetical protein